MSKYPEHDKMRAVKTESQAQGAFIDWLREERGYELCVLDRSRVGTPRYEPVRKRIEELLADFHEIDLKKIQDEKDAMLEEQRRLNEESRHE